jgi:hypothetical protein
MMQPSFFAGHRCATLDAYNVSMTKDNAAQSNKHVQLHGDADALEQRRCGVALAGSLFICLETGRERS